MTKLKGPKSNFFSRSSMRCEILGPRLNRRRCIARSRNVITFRRTKSSRRPKPASPNLRTRAKADLIDTEKRGVWVLTEQGRKANLSHDDAYQLFRAIHDGFQRDDGHPSEALSSPAVNGQGALRALPPDRRSKHLEYKRLQLIHARAPWYFNKSSPFPKRIHS